MDFIDKHIESYAQEHSSSETSLLSELNRDTWAAVLQPRMLSGHLQGRFLSLISKLQQPKNILEIGTYTGYSALCLAEGLAKNGELHTIDINEELEDRILNYFDKSEFKNQLHLHIGNALEIIPSLKKDFDLVFIDADKENYIKYYQLLISQLKKGALIIADNVLWSGKVLEKSTDNDIDTNTLKAFNKMVQEDPRVENILLPLRDGLMLARVI